MFCGIRIFLCVFHVDSARQHAFTHAAADPLVDVSQGTPRIRMQAPLARSLYLREAVVQKLMDNIADPHRSVDLMDHLFTREHVMVQPSPATHAIWTQLKAGECIRNSL